MTLPFNRFIKNCKREREISEGVRSFVEGNRKNSDFCYRCCDILPKKTSEIVVLLQIDKTQLLYTRGASKTRIR